MIQTVQHFNWIDYTILAIVGLSAVISFFRGFVREAISLLAWVLGLFAALAFATTLEGSFKGWITSETVRYFISFVIIFLVIVILGLVVNLLVGLLLKSSGLSVVDRFVGIIFGTLRGMAIVAVLLLMLSHLGSVKDSVTLAHSRLANQFKPVVGWLDSFLPEKMKLMTTWVMNDFNNRREQVR